MQAIILASGVGSRLGTLTEDTPKCLVRVAGRSLLERQLDALGSLGVHDILITTGHMQDRVEAAVGGRARFQFNPFFASTNNLVSLWLCRHWMTDDCLVFHADMLFALELVRATMDAEGDVVLLCDESCHVRGHLRAQADAQGRIVAVNRDMDPAVAYGRFLGLAKFSRRIVPAASEALEGCVKDGLLDSYYVAAVERLIGRGADVCPCPTEGRAWQEIDYPEDFEEAQKRWT
jgi:L-glutamine-phosphate cytidylyltransferase